MKLLYSVATDSLNPEFLDFLFISITFYIYPIYFVIIWNVNLARAKEV